MDDLAPADYASPEPGGALCQNLIQVVYRSRCLTDEAGERDILESSRRNNPACNITGVLVSHGGWFMKVLEGPAKAVSDLLTQISVDNRNGEFLLLRAARLETRDFPEWSMASTSMDEDRFVRTLNDFMSGKSESRQLLRDFMLGGRLWQREQPHSPVRPAGSTPSGVLLAELQTQQDH